MQGLLLFGMEDERPVKAWPGIEIVDVLGVLRIDDRGRGADREVRGRRQ